MTNRHNPKFHSPYNMLVRRAIKRTDETSANDEFNFSLVVASISKDRHSFSDNYKLIEAYNL